MKPIVFCLLLVTLALATDFDARVLSRPDFVQLGPSRWEFRYDTQVFKPQTQPTVPFVFSSLRLSGQLPLPELSESSLLESGYRVDLNGNGEIDQVHLAEGVGPQLDQLALQTVKVDKDFLPYREDGEPKRYRLAAQSPEFMLESCQANDIVLDVEHHGQRPEVVDLPNPCLMVYLYEPAVGPAGPDDSLAQPTFDLEVPENKPCRQFLSYRWQHPPPIAPNHDHPQWLRVCLLAFPLRNQNEPQSDRFRLNLSAATQYVGFFGQVIYAPEAGRQRISPASSFLLWPGVRSTPAGCP
ncbi:MAG: hypothetical protein U0931_18100 [Vulcanimicrobiota bacterium]